MENKDDVIPFEHSEELCNACKGPTCLILSSEMDHNRFFYNQDFLKPLCIFLKRYKVIKQEAYVTLKQPVESIDLPFISGNSRNKEVIISIYFIEDQEYMNREDLVAFNPSELLKTLKSSRILFESQKAVQLNCEERLLCVDSKSSIATLSLPQSDDEIDIPEAEEPMLTIKKFPESLISNRTICPTSKED